MEPMHCWHQVSKVACGWLWCGKLERNESWYYIHRSGNVGVDSNYGIDIQVDECGGKELNYKEYQN